MQMRNEYPSPNEVLRTAIGLLALVALAVIAVWLGTLDGDLKARSDLSERGNLSDESACVEALRRAPLRLSQQDAALGWLDAVSNGEDAGPCPVPIR